MSASKKTSLATSTQNLISTIKQNRDRYIAFAFASAHLFLEVDRTGTITYAAGASSALRKGPAYTLLGEKFIQFIVAADRDYFKEILKHLFIHHRIDPRPLKLNTASGHEITLMVGGFIMPDSPSTINLAFTIPPKSVGASSHHKKDEETGLLDKKVFADAAKEQLETSNRMGQESKLTMFVIDGLEEISKTGDPFALSRALDKIAAYMRAISLDGGTATQFDTEKFGLLHGANVTEEEVRSRINEIVEEELDGATEAKSFAIDFDPGELDEEDAAKALSYSIKKFVEEDPANFSISSLQSSAKEMMSDTLSRISNVREIIEKKNFDVVYQPIVDLYMEEPHHLEALTRVTGLSSPQSFITFTEEVGLIEDFDLALAQKVLDDLDNHAKSGWRPKVAINISARSMSSKIFLDGFKEVLKPFENVKKQLMLELTETVAVSNFEKLNKTLQDFRAQGIEVCLDDVGAGSTSFQSLYDLQVDYLKIDGKFVREAAENPRDMAMLKSIIKNGKQLGCKLIAEQIEDPDQARLMESLEIDFGQGYLYGRPTMDHSMLRSHKQSKTYKSRPASTQPKVLLTDMKPDDDPEGPDDGGNGGSKAPKHRISMNLRRTR
ncbi:EAL domain-containing protein [Curvivirga sp.]|uniref:EAL domain-containing protein n=1 Tax=Curvivirga sp. TaxID=2856848 RepID=UPI003B5AEF66